MYFCWLPAKRVPKLLTGNSRIKQARCPRLGTCSSAWTTRPRGSTATTRRPRPRARRSRGSSRSCRSGTYERVVRDGMVRKMFFSARFVFFFRNFLRDFLSADSALSNVGNVHISSCNNTVISNISGSTRYLLTVSLENRNIPRKNVSNLKAKPTNNNNFCRKNAGTFAKERDGI